MPCHDLEESSSFSRRGMTHLLCDLSQNMRVDGSLLVKRHDIAGFRRSSLRACLAQHGRRYVPMLATVSNDRNGLLVVSDYDAKDNRPPVGLETDALSEEKLEHRCVSAHLLQ